MSEREQEVGSTWPANAKPTPEQLADWFLSIPRDERIERAEVLLDAMDRADACFLHNHKALADEVESLRRWKSEALPVIAGLQDLGRALGLRLGETITGPAAAKAASDLRATVDRVRVVEAAMWNYPDWDGELHAWASDLRDAIKGD